MHVNRYQAGGATYRIAMRSMHAAIAGELRDRELPAAGDSRSASPKFTAAAKFQTQNRISPCGITGGM